MISGRPSLSREDIDVNLFSGIDMSTIAGKKEAAAAALKKAAEMGINLPEIETEAR